MAAETRRLAAGSTQCQPVTRMMTPATTTPAETAASATRWRKAPRTFASDFRAHEQEGRSRVHRDADRGRNDDDAATRVRLFAEPLDRLQAERAHGDEEEDRIGERREDRRAPEAVRAAPRGLPLREPRSAPREREAEHVGEVVPGVRDERDRSRDEPGDDLHDHERHVERDPDRERAPRVRGTVRVVVSMVMAHAALRSAPRRAPGASRADRRVLEA